MDPVQQTEANQSSIDAALRTLQNPENFDIPVESFPSDLESNLSILADASRTNIPLRNGLATPETINSLLRVVSISLQDQSTRSLITTSALRCIGNTCINNDAARSMVIGLGDSSWASACLTNKDHDIVETSLKVIYNLCVDYEPAHVWGYAEKLHEILIVLLSDGKPAEACVDLDEAERGLGFELLFWITSQRPAPPVPHQGIEDPPVTTIDRRMPPTLLHKLLRLPYLYAPTLDSDDFAMVAEICLTYLRDPIVQQQILECKLVQYVWRMLCDNEQKVQLLQGEKKGSEPQLDEIKLLVALSSSLTWCLSDIAASSVAADKATDRRVQVERSFLEGLANIINFLGAPEEDQTTLQGVWQKGNDMTRQGSMVQIRRVPIPVTSLLKSEDLPEFQARSQKLNVPQEQDEANSAPRSNIMLIAACQFLANSLWGHDPQPNDRSWAGTRLCDSLWSAIARTEDAELLHSAAGLLVQLSRQSLDLRELMAGGRDAIAALERLCSHSVPQVKQDSIRLLQALGKDSPANQARFAALAKEVLESAAKDAETADAT